MFQKYPKHRFSYEKLLEAVSSSTILEVDKVNETVRLRENYQKWLYPNNEGGFGYPRWIKQAPEASAEPDPDPESDPVQDSSTIEKNNEGDLPKTESNAPDESVKENVEKEISTLSIEEPAKDNMQ